VNTGKQHPHPSASWGTQKHGHSTLDELLELLEELLELLDELLELLEELLLELDVQQQSGSAVMLPPDSSSCPFHVISPTGYTPLHGKFLVSLSVPDPNGGPVHVPHPGGQSAVLIHTPSV